LACAFLLSKENNQAADSERYFIERSFDGENRLKINEKAVK
jgi:hypothetical protein